MQQGYEFGCVVCLYTHVYYDKKGLFGVLPLEKSPVSEFTARLSSLMAKNGVYYARRKKFGSILLMGQGKGLWKILLMQAMPCLQAVYYAYSYAVLNANMKLQCRATVLLQVQPVLTMLSVHRVCVLRNSSYPNTWI